MIAVKKLHDNSPVASKTVFLREATNLMVLHHENIVKLLSCCHEATKKMLEHNGKYILVDIDEFVLCYEYVPKGSLADYLSGT